MVMNGSETVSFLSHCNLCLLMTPFYLLFLLFTLSQAIHKYHYTEPIAKEPHWWKVVWMRNRIQELRVIIPPRLYSLLSSDPQLPFVLKESLHAAIAACKQSNLERNEKLTCTFQSGRPYGDLFKTISAYDSRDFSFLISLTTAFAVRSIAEACAEGRLIKCSCDNKYTGSINGRPRGFYWNECVDRSGSHNIPYAIKLSRKLIDHQYECVVPSRLREVILHNISVGRTRVASTIQCLCHSLHCQHKCCQVRVTDESFVLHRVRESLRNSRRIRRSNRVEMRIGMCNRRNRDRKNRERRSSLWFVEESGWNVSSFYLGIPL